MIRKGYNYYTSNIKAHESAKCGFHTFTLRDDIEQGTSDHKYQYYSCISFSPVILVDGNKIKIDNINSISSKMFNDKQFHNLNLDITVLEQDVP